MGAKLLAAERIENFDRHSKLLTSSVMQIYAMINDYRDLMSIQNGTFTILNEQFSVREAIDEIVLSYDLLLFNSALSL
jgi:hypothetical protein